MLEDKKGLTLEAAKGMAEAAGKHASAKGWKMVIAIVDDGANLLYLERMDGGSIGSIEVAQQKARTAVIFKTPSKSFEEGLAASQMSLLKLEILPYEGGVPIVVDGKIIGAIGVSGASAPEDGQTAQAGAAWLERALGR